MNNIVVFAECKLDFKYRKIVEGLDIDYRSINFKKFLESSFSLKKNTTYYYHIRYLKWRGPFLSIAFYLFIISFCKIRGIRIIWTCHNVLEHKYPSAAINNIIKYLISYAAMKIVIFHKDVLKGLPYKMHFKVSISNFGNFKEHFQSLSKVNNDFTENYKQWLLDRKIHRPDIVFIGAFSKLKNIDLLIDFLNQHKHINALIIAPKLVSETIEELEFKECQIGNAFIYMKNNVEKEIDNILKTPDIIGYVGHNNLSVPTSIYMFASYNIPVLGFDVEPVNSILSEYGIGEVFKDADSLIEKYSIIKNNYENYKGNLIDFLEYNNWPKASLLHKQIFSQKIPE